MVSRGVFGLGGVGLVVFWMVFLLDFFAFFQGHTKLRETKLDRKCDESKFISYSEINKILKIAYFFPK